MATKLSDSEIEARLEDLVDWTREGDEIRKLFKLASFPGAIGFVTQVAFLAEAAGGQGCTTVAGGADKEERRAANRKAEFGLRLFLLYYVPLQTAYRLLPNEH